MAKEWTYDFSTKEEMLAKLADWHRNGDDNNIFFKEKIKQELLHCPELLYSLNDKELEKELFNPDGTLNEEGEWDLYFGTTGRGHIRPYLFFPEVQTEVCHYLCYQTQFLDVPEYNKSEVFGQVWFTCYVHGDDPIDQRTGIARHDLIQSVIRERFNWSNIFVNQFTIASDKESISDNNYIVRSTVYEGIVPRMFTKTQYGYTRTIKHEVHA